MNLLSHTTARVEMSLVPALDDPDIAGVSLQTLFGKFHIYLRISGIPVTSQMFYDPEGDKPDGFVGAFASPLNQALNLNVTLLLVAWLEGRRNRAIALRVSDRHFAAQSADEIQALLGSCQQRLMGPAEATASN